MQKHIYYMAKICFLNVENSRKLVQKHNFYFFNNKIA